MIIFHHPFTDIEKLSIVTPFEPDKFPSISRPRITPHMRGQKRREISSRAISNKKPDAGSQIWEKNGVSKVVKLTPLRNMSKQKQSENAGKGTQKKCRRKMNWKKMGWNENEKKQGRKTKAELVPHAMKNDLWSNYPKTQFGPTYYFFRNSEPRPTLRAVKVHFDWTWILRLKRFFSLENFHPKSAW